MINVIVLLQCISKMKLFSTYPHFIQTIFFECFSTFIFILTIRKSMSSQIEDVAIRSIDIPFFISRQKDVYVQ